MALLETIGVVGGTALAGPAGGAAGGGIGAALTNLFGGPGRDASRQQNVDWYAAAALQGSVIAARVIIAAPANVASNEDPMWIAAAGKVSAQRPDVWAAAQRAGGLWVNGTIQQVQAELQNIAQISTVTSIATPAAPAQVLAGMVTTAPAPSSLSPIVLVMLALAAVFGVILIVRTH